MKINRIGVINWNAALPRSTYFGGWALNSLDTEKYRDRLPYFTTFDKETGKAEFPELTQELTDRQLEYALSAGIDYFAYCWYTSTEIRDVKSQVDIEAGWNELNRMRRFHVTSRLRERVKLCAILRPSKMNDEDYAELAGLMGESFYEKLDGRPLAYFFGNAEENRIGKQKLDAACTSLGIKSPFTAIVTGSAGVGEFDAVSRYAYCGAHESFAELVCGDMQATEKQKSCGLPIIPHFSAGWNPDPRVDRPIPWTTYPTGLTYAPAPDSDGLAEMAESLVKWVDENPEFASTGHVLTFAWNEFEEGGYICPTLGADGEPNTAILESFARAVKIMKGEK